MAIRRPYRRINQSSVNGNGGSLASVINFAVMPTVAVVAAPTVSSRALLQYPTQQPDGTENVFTFNVPAVSEDAIQLFLGGLIQCPGMNYDYTATVTDTQTIVTMNYVPEGGLTLLAYF